MTGVSLRQHVVKMLTDDKVYDFGGVKNTLSGFINFKKGGEESILVNENDSLPMYFVSWEEAMKLCKNLISKEKVTGRLPAGYEYNLPTEAQWEYACRAGTTTVTFSGALVTQVKNAPMLNDYAWYAGNSGINYKGK